MQGHYDSTPHRPPTCSQESFRQPFHVTPWLPIRQEKIESHDMSTTVDMSNVGESHLEESPLQSVRPKSTQLATHREIVTPPVVSWLKPGTHTNASVQVSAHDQAPDNHVYPTSNHILPIATHPHVSCQTSMHDSVTPVQAPPDMAIGMQADMHTSPNIPYSTPATVILPHTNLIGHPQPIQAPHSSYYGVPNTMYSSQSDSVLPPAPPVFSGTMFSHKLDPVQAHQAPYDPKLTLRSNYAVASSSSAPVYAPATMPAYPASRIYAQQPSVVQQLPTAPSHIPYQQGTNQHASAMTKSPPSFTQTHQVRNVQVFSGGPECKILIEDWIRDMQYLLEAGGMPPNLCFATLVRHLNGEARRLVLNLPPSEQTTRRAFDELRAEYSDMQTSLDPLADFYERCQRSGETARSYAIALEATLRSVEETQYGGQTFPDRDGKLTRQFMRGLSDEEVYHRLAPMKPQLLSFRELQAELRNLAGETKKFQMLPKSKKAYTQAQFTAASGNRSGESAATEKGNRQNNDLTELTAMVKKLVISQEDQVSRLSQLEARFAASPRMIFPQTQRPQGSSDTPSRSVVCYRCNKPGHIARLCRTIMTDEVSQAENQTENSQDLNA